MNLESGATSTPTSKKPAPETPAPSSHREQLTTTSPQDVSVQVYNATGQSGLATTVKAGLELLGVGVGNPRGHCYRLTTRVAPR